MSTSNTPYKSDTLAYYLHTLYGINDPSANFTITPKEIKAMKAKHTSSRTPKSFRKAVQKRRNQRFGDQEE